MVSRLAAPRAPSTLCYTMTDEHSRISYFCRIRITSTCNQGLAGPATSSSPRKINRTKMRLAPRALVPVEPPQNPAKNPPEILSTWQCEVPSESLPPQKPRFLNSLKSPYLLPSSCISQEIQIGIPSSVCGPSLGNRRGSPDLTPCSD